MNYTDYRISLDIFKTASQAVLPVKQGDTAYRLCITITANGSPYRITEGCYALFTAKKPDGNFINNECTIENNVIYYQLTPQTTAAIGVVECEVILYDSNDEQLATPHFNILVDAKAYNGEEIESTNETNILEALIQDSITQINEVEEKLANGEFNGKDGKDGRDGVDGKDGKDGKDADYNLVCNALKGSASGNPIRIDDVSPLEHEIAVGLRSKNLIPYPYSDATQTINGITFTDNGDGTITANGTATANAEFNIRFPSIWFAPGEYIFSGCPSGGGSGKYLMVGSAGYNDAWIVDSWETGNGLAVIAPNGIEKISVALRIYSGMTVNNLVFKPQLELGTTATPYTPYVDVNGASVTRYGKNLCNPYEFTLGQDWNGNPNPSLAVLNIPCLPNTSYVISWNEEAKNKVKFIIEKTSTTATTSNNTFIVSTNTDKSFTTKPNTNCICVLVQDLDYNYLITYDFVESLKIQIEKGTTATEYEPYKEPAEYVADENGNVSVTSVYPTTTLTADNGVSISAEYNRDLNKAFAELMQAVAAAKEV